MTNADILRRWARRLAPVGVIAAVLWIAVQGRYGSLLRHEGHMAPAGTAQLSDGSRLELGKPKGEVVVVNFWATWCAPCRAEAPELTKLNERLQREGLGRVVGLAVEQRSVEGAAKAARALGMRYPIGLASDALLQRFGVQALPTTFLIGRDGRVIKSFLGGITADEVTADLPASGGSSGN